MTTPIDFLDATNGGIRLYNRTADGKRDYVGWGTTAETIAMMIETCGIADTVYAGSSMEFAAEDGFKTNDGAMVLWNKAKELYFWG